MKAKRTVVPTNVGVEGFWSKANVVYVVRASAHGSSGRSSMQESQNLSELRAMGETYIQQ